MQKKESKFSLWKQYLFVVESFSPLLEGESSCKILMIDTETGAVQEACNIKGTVTKLSLKDSSYTHRFNAAMAKFDNDNAYFGLQFSSSEDSSSRNNTKSFTEYLKISLANGAMTEITEAEFEGAQDLSANITGAWDIRKRQVKSISDKHTVRYHRNLAFRRKLLRYHKRCKVGCRAEG